MRKYVREEHEKRISGIGVYEFQGLFMYQVLGIGPESPVRIVFEDDFPVIFPKMVGIIIVCEQLAVVSEKFVYPLCGRVSDGPRGSKPPFSENSRPVAVFLKKQENIFHFRKRELSFRRGFDVSPDRRVP